MALQATRHQTKTTNLRVRVKIAARRFVVSGFVFLGLTAAVETSARTPTPAQTQQPTPTWASDAERVADARKRRGDYYANRLTLFLKEAPARPKGGVVFLGDSITERIPLQEAFQDENVVNRGIGGDSISGVIERLDVSIEQLQPTRVYLLIGINDLVWVKNKSVQHFAEQYAELLNALENAAPNAEIICQSVLPVRGRWARFNSKIDEFNDLIRPLAEKHGFRYIDLHPWMTDDAGELVATYTTDGIHLTLEGNIAWLECILPREEFMKAAVNLAPYREKERGISHEADAVDPRGQSEFGGGRGSNQLIVYTPAYGHPTTKTNEWGYEAVVTGGVVTHSGGNDSAIPPDGFVVSGHGTAATWVLSNLTTGTMVQLDGATVRYTPSARDAASTGQRLRALRYRVLGQLPELAKSGLDSPGMKEAATILGEIHQLQGEQNKVKSDEVDAVTTRMEGR